MDQPHFWHVLRRIVSIVSLLLGAVAAITYLIATLISEQNPYSKRLWILSASSGLTAVGFDWLCKWFSDRDAKDMSRRLKQTESRADGFESRIPRRITESGLEALKAALQKYPRQHLEVIAEDDRAGEVNGFARNLSGAFTECGWSNTPSCIHRSAGTGVWICSTAKNGDSKWSAEIIGDITAVLKADGIVVVEREARIDPNPLPEGCIEINIGRKPTT